ncbi:serine hydrolase domain-containing protein [Algoriphagus namhaensis]|uniref:Serine hydrolase domain-containing protein n=1 Tax=Algoriphagus namhaensis TaxID=915353 RepID=A0ABV8ALN7_9BACT
MDRIKPLSLCTISVLLFLSYTASAQTLKQATEVNSIIQTNQIPGISLAYIEAGAMKIELATGKKSETETVGGETVFSAASLSKPVFAYLVMKLVDEGTLDLDTPLSEYYEYVDLKGQKSYPKVTAKMILSHTSGLPNWRKNKLKFIHEPGEKYSYSGEGYVWLQRVVENLKKKSLEQLAQEHVFDPFGMDRTSYIFSEKLSDDFSISFKKDGEARPKTIQGQANAAASLQTTASDYAKFLIALLNGEGIPKELQDQMFTPVKPVKEKEKNPQIFWGLGVGIQKTPAGTQIFQWGDNWTFKGYFTANIKDKNGLVYFTNSENGLIPVRELVGTYLSDPQPAADWLDYH